MHEKSSIFRGLLFLHRRWGTIMTWVCFFSSRNAAVLWVWILDVSEGILIYLGPSQWNSCCLEEAPSPAKIRWKKWLGSGLRVGYVKFNYSTDTLRFRSWKNSNIPWFVATAVLSVPSADHPRYMLVTTAGIAQNWNLCTVFGWTKHCW